MVSRISARRSTSAPPASLIWLTLFTLFGVGVLLSLGVWQLQRLAWKNDILARIETRIHARAGPLPGFAAWPDLASGDHEYERYVVTGVYLADRLTYIWRSSGKAAGELAQPGYWQMAALQLADGSQVLINRGFIVRDRQPAAQLRTAPLPAGVVTLTGLLRLPETRSYFTPPDTPANGDWFTRDPVAIAAALKLDHAAPFSIDEDAHEAARGEPAGGATVLDIPNNHLSYALTWFALAATLAGVFLVFVWKHRRDA